jgi:uncharacterized protein (DUF2141 family)
MDLHANVTFVQTKNKNVMKKIFKICGALALLSAGSISYAQQVSTLTVDQVPDAKSKIYVGFYEAKNDFPKHGKHAFRKVIEPNGTSSVTKTWTVPAGEYALAVYQDLNNNDHLETGLFGIPKEPFGLSTNLKAGLFNLPTFKKCRVDVKEGSQFTIRLRK